MSTSHTLHVFDIDITFRADANKEELAKAQELLETRADQLRQQSKAISRDKMLLFLSLGLAYDLLQANAQLSSIQSRLEDMLNKVEDARSIVEHGEEEK